MVTDGIVYYYAALHDVLDEVVLHDKSRSRRHCEIE
jgi:hypothetical protein